ncbi:MAG TPA: pyridoxamine 5'-phosphate oxidase family protein [Burkholderiales bacterium]|nr:pyridoxamine 5'-phosphate oxidase family protein [Burkholderiales bacterium]
MAGVDSLAERIEAFLDAHHVVTLATVGEAGAHAASLMYARNGFALYWTSDPATRHSLHLEREARVTATIAPDYTDFRVVRGLQIAGQARRLDGREAEDARAALVGRYAFLAELASGPPALRAAFAKAAFYALVPERITLVDNSLGFGHKETLTLQA